MERRHSTIYCISGLGADSRVFKDLKTKGIHIRPLDWISAEANETVAEYATRFARFHTLHREKKFMLLGLSFGGVIAQEIAKDLHPEKLILVSSFLSRSELPLTLRILSKLHLEKWIPESMILNANRFNHWLFTLSEKKDIDLFNQIMKDTDPNFFRWALGAIATWSGQPPYENTIRIHGNQDRIIPRSNIGESIEIPGGHLALMTHAEHVNRLLEEKLKRRKRK